MTNYRIIWNTQDGTVLDYHRELMDSVVLPGMGCMEVSGTPVEVRVSGSAEHGWEVYTLLAGVEKPVYCGTLSEGDLGFSQDLWEMIRGDELK